MSNYQAYKAKANQLAVFVRERTMKNEKSLCIDSKRGRSTFLSGDKYSFVLHALEIIQKYINKFFEIRKSDFEVRQDEYRAETSASSYAKHMRPSMLEEFDRSYITALKYLNYNIFYDSTNELTIGNSDKFLPRIMKNGAVKYNDEKSDKKEEEKKDTYIEVCEKVGQSLIFYKKEREDKPKPNPIKRKDFNEIVEKWNREGEEEKKSWRFKITIPTVVDGKWINIYQYL
jgi:hypothetical protein